PVLKEENIPTDEEEIKKNLLMQFIDGKLDRQVTRNTHNFKSEKTKIWLKWLAKLMSEKKLTTFELSNLQPSDLLGIRLYKIVFCAALLVCLINWLSIFLLLSKKATRANLSGLFATNNRIKVTKWNRLIKVFSNTKTAVFISVLLGGFNLLVGRSESTGMLMVIGVCFGLVFDASSKKIETEDVAKWNLWGLINTKNWSRSIEFGASFGVYFCVLATLLAFIPSSIFTPFKLASLWRVGQYALVVGYVIGQLLNPFWFSLMIGLIVGFFGSLLESCHQIFPFRSLERPYQRFKGGFISNGIVLTVLNFPLSLLYIILLLTLSNFQFPPLIYLFLYIFIWVFIFAILISIPSFIITPLFRHLILRFCLYLEGSMPLQYATFLNYVAEARILEKDGGQWRFRHQILQDHFWKPSSPSW
ncbi:MAG: hypothetical protein QOD00_2130, partial [Blastocatellia bacterium]|nr:hypothetical protein [Blastocatellia bacterium]